jgi:hypothetical protein
MEPDFFLDVDLDDDVKLDDYNDALSTYKEWKSIYREIKLNLLLEQGKRIEFDIDNISKFITLDSNDDVVPMKNICCTVSGMTFILNDSKIEKLTLKVHCIENQNGEIVKAILKDGLFLTIKQVLIGNHLFFNMIPTSLQEHRDKQLEKIIPKK